MRRPRILDLEDLPTREKRRAALTQIYGVYVGGGLDMDLVVDIEHGRAARRMIATLELARRYHLEVLQ